MITASRGGVLAALLVWLVLSALKWLVTGGAAVSSASEAVDAVRETAFLQVAGQRPLALGGEAAVQSAAGSSGGADVAPCLRGDELMDAVRNTDTAHQQPYEAAPPHRRASRCHAWRCRASRCHALLYHASRRSPSTRRLTVAGAPMRGQLLTRALPRVRLPRVPVLRGFASTTEHFALAAAAGLAANAAAAPSRRAAAAAAAAATIAVGCCGQWQRTGARRG